MVQLILNLSAFLAMLGTGMIMAILPQRILDLSSSLSSVGELASAFALTFVLAQIPMGWLSDRFGIKRFMVTGYFICAGTGLIYYVSDSCNHIFMGRMLQGIGEVPVWSLAPALLAIQYPDQKGKYMGLYNASMHCGLTLGSLLGIWMAKIWEADEAFLFFAFTSFSAGLLIALFVKPPVHEGTGQTLGDAGLTDKKPKGKTALLSLISNAENLVTYMGILMYGAGYGIFITMIPGFLIQVRGLDQAGIGFFFVCFYMAVGLSQIAAGGISDSWGRKPVMILGLGLAGSGLICFSGTGLVWTIFFLTLAAFGLGTYCVSALAFLNEQVSEEEKGIISGCFYFFWGIGYFSGPLCIGNLIQGISDQPGIWRISYQILALLFFIQLAGVCFFLKGSYRQGLNTSDSTDNQISP